MKRRSSQERVPRRRGRTRNLVVYLIASLFLAQNGNFTEAKSYRWYCYLSSQVVEIVVDLETGQVVGFDADIESGRRLRREVFDTGASVESERLLMDDLTEDELEWTANGIQVSQRAMQGDSTPTNIFEEAGEGTVAIRARACLCGNSSSRAVFCPLNAATVCGVPDTRKEDQNVACFQNNGQNSTMRKLLGACVLLVILCMAVSRTGRNSFNYIMGTCVPSWNDAVVRQILDEARRRLRQIEGRQNDSTNTGVLALKTKVYKSDKSKEEKPHIPENEGELWRDDDDNECTCMICISGIEDGDRIGDLPGCSHNFHVDCLKLWIQRRNVCPLCQNMDIATPVRPPTPTLHQSSFLVFLELALADALSLMFASRL
eukprot:scaffold31989_cov54-Attheya_sp.AAC.1